MSKSSTLLAAARSKVDSAEAAYTDLLNRVEARSNELESTGGDVASVLDQFKADLDDAEARFTEAKAMLAKAQSIEEARADSQLIPRGDRVTVGDEPTTYRRSDPDSPSFFADLYAWQASADHGALERLKRGSKETLVDVERRGITLRDKEGRALSSTSGSGGDFLPPLYFGDLYAEYKRARRVTAGLVRNLQLAARGNSITVPRITGGSLAASQQDNANVSNQDPTTSIITIPVCTIAGYVDLSRQIVERSEPGMDELVAEDLISSYNKQLNNYVLNGSGSGGEPKGLLNTSYNAVTYTDTTPTVAELYPKLLDAMRQVEENVFQPPTAWVMTARRWAWILDAVDSQGRPLVVPDGQGPWNSMGVLASGEAKPFGVNNAQIVAAGTLLGLPVFVDETLPKTQGAGTDQDVIVAAAWNEHILWEDAPRVFRYEGVASATAAIRVQAFGYAAFTGERFADATSVIAGTGLVSPTF